MYGNFPSFLRKYSHQDPVFEWHKVEVDQLSCWPDFPVGGHNVKICSLQILFHILNQNTKKRANIFKNLPKEKDPEVWKLLLQRRREKQEQRILGPEPSLTAPPWFRGT